MPTTKVKHTSKGLLKWSDFKFGVASKDITGIKDISLAGSCETEEKESDGEKYNSFKNRKPFDFSVKVVLNANLTDDVKGKTLKLVETASKGESHYLYLGNEKLLTPRFMLTSAKTTKVTIAAGNNWYSSEIDLTFKQSTKYDGTATASSGGKSSGSGTKGGTGKKASVKKQSWLTTAGKKLETAGAVDALKAIKTASAQTSAAKTQSRRTLIRGASASAKKTVNPMASNRRISGATR